MSSDFNVIPLHSVSKMNQLKRVIGVSLRLGNFRRFHKMPNVITLSNYSNLSTLSLFRFNSLTMFLWQLTLLPPYCIVNTNIISPSLCHTISGYISPYLLFHFICLVKTRIFCLHQLIHPPYFDDLKASNSMRLFSPLVLHSPFSRVVVILSPLPRRSCFPHPFHLTS